MDLWLQMLLFSLPAFSMFVVPFTARRVSTPLSAQAWFTMLQDYPNTSLVQFILDGMCLGFHIGFTRPQSSLKSARNNLEGAQQHPDVVSDYLHSEVLMGRVVGLFSPRAIPHVHISRFGVIPKGQMGKWRLIVDLSHPKDHSVNDGISKPLCSLKYVTIDDAIKEIIQLGRGTLLAKIDIKSAFRLLPVHPADRHMLGMWWNDGVFINTCFPFWLRSAPKLFNFLADMLVWIAGQSGLSFLLHYLDDFLTIGSPSSPTFQRNLKVLTQICNYLGVPLTFEKGEGQSTVLSFLGIVLDTTRMEARLPEDKLTSNRTDAMRREILSLVGSVQHATKVVQHDRAFVSRMYATAAKLRELHFHTRLNVEFCSDLCWWHTFLTD